MNIKEAALGIGVLPSILRRLTNIANKLDRMCDLYEKDLESRGVLMREATTYASEEAQKKAMDEFTDGLYTDEEYDYAREVVEEMGKVVKEHKPEG